MPLKCISSVRTQSTEMTITSEQQIAIDFYADNLQYVESFGLMNLDKEERLLYRKGKKLLESALSLKEVKTSGHTKWTIEEYHYLAGAYFNHGRNQRECLNYFRKFSDRHTDKSVMIAVYSCAALDKKVKEISGLKDYADGLLNALNEIEPGRFVGTRK